MGNVGAAAESTDSRDDTTRQAQADQLVAEIPPQDCGDLAGEPLQRPTFHPVSWQDGDQFSAEDDPDRTIMQWAAPAFCCSGDQRPATVAEDLLIPENCSEHGHSDRSFARLVHNVLTPVECKVFPCPRCSSVHSWGSGGWCRGVWGGWGVGVVGV